MTILISDMSDTVVASYKRGTFTLAHWTVLPKQGFFREFLDAHPRLMRHVTAWIQRRQEKARLKRGFQPGPGLDPSDPTAQTDPDQYPPDDPVPTLEQLATGAALDEHDLARKLALAIRRTAQQLKMDYRRRYTYEEWVEYTRLIRFTSYAHENGGGKGGGDARERLEEAEEDEGIVDWDWIGEDSPMMADQSEAEWVLDRLCESLERYMRRWAPLGKGEKRRRRRKSLGVGRRSRDGERKGTKDGDGRASEREEQSGDGAGAGSGGADEYDARNRGNAATATAPAAPSRDASTGRSQSRDAGDAAGVRSRRTFSRSAWEGRGSNGRVETMASRRMRRE